MTALALERAPATALPLRFLRLVPLWGLAAAALLWWQGPTLWASRWNPATVALVHVLTLGVLGNAILGSLLQFLPVAAGVQPRGVPGLGRVLPAAFNAGALGLVCGLLRWPLLVPAAGAILAGSLAAFALAALAGIRLDGRQTGLRLGLAAALLGLLGTALLGLALALGWVGWLPVPMPSVTDAHAAFGLLGTVLMLLAAVGSVVVPMFQGTRPVPSRWLGGWLVALPLALAAGVGLRLGGVLEGEGMARLLALPVVAFALGVLTLQWRPPHRRNPALVGFWRLGAAALLLAGALAGLVPGPRIALLAGALGLGVGLPALVLGMLLEIVAFLAWLELQQRRPRGTRVPGVDALLPEPRKARLLRWHAAAALMLVLAAAWPHPATTAATAIVLAAAYGLTSLTLVATRRRARRGAGWRHLPMEHRA